MYTINNLAEELEKDESYVRDKLINYGYLKQNGESRQATIDKGLMSKTGKITQFGWTSFIAEIIIRDFIKDEKNIRKYICAANKGAKAIFLKNNSGLLREIVNCCGLKFESA